MRLDFLRRLADFAELRTKITSVLLFPLLLAFFLMRSWPLRGGLSALFFFSVFMVDLAVTMISNAADKKREKGHASLPFSDGQARRLMLLIFSLAMISGLLLACLTDFFVLLIGVLLFLTGLAYALGPCPFSRLPLGEHVSGFAYGFFIPLLFFYINLPQEQFLHFALKGDLFVMSLNHGNFVAFLLFSLAPISATANIMLANNCCDMEKDKSNGRKTLPIVIGRERALYLFRLLSLLPYLAAILMLALRIASPPVLLFFFSLPLVLRMQKRFLKEQKKETSFHCSLINYRYLIGGLSICYALAHLLHVFWK